MSRGAGWSFVYGLARGFGKTTAMVKACKELDGTLVCLDARQAAELRREHGIRAVSVDASPDRLRGGSGAILFDPDAVGRMAMVLERERDVAQAELDSALRERDAARADLEHLKSVVFVPLSVRTGSKSYAEWHAESDAWLGKLQAELAETRAREEGLREALHTADEYLSEHVPQRPGDAARIRTLRLVRAALSTGRGTT